MGIYYAPYPELSDIIISDLLKESVIKRSVFLSRYTKKYGHHRVVKTLTNLQALGIIYRFENGCFSILGANENVRALHPDANAHPGLHSQTWEHLLRSIFPADQS